MSDMPHGAEHDGGVSVSAEELDRERLVTYLDWAEADVPAWWLPTYALLVTAWIASHDLSGWWPTAASAVFVVAIALMLRALTRSYGVSMPRFRGMPAALKRTYVVPGVVFVLTVAAAIALTAAMADPPYTLLGLVAGPALGLSLAWQVRRCRVVATRLRREEGITR